MSNKDKKYDAYITSDNKIRLDLTPEEHQEIVKKGMPTGLRIVSKNKQEKSLVNADDDTIFDFKRSEVADDQIETLREAEAEERANDA